MYNVFNTVPPIVGTSFTYQGMPYARDQVIKNVTRAKEYYRTNYFRVKSDHVLCKIIHSINVDTSLRAAEYADAVASQASSMLTLHGLTSPSMKSRPNYKGDFFGDQSVEIYLSDESTVDIDNLDENWRDLTPVVAVTHFRSDLTPIRLGMPFKGSERGLAVLRINVVALMLQYRMWTMSFESMANEGVEQFVGNYPLVNVLDSVTDIAVFNRYYNHLMGLPMGVATTNVPFMTLNNESHIDKVIKISHSKLLTTMMGPSAILMNIPVIYAPTAFHLQLMDDYQPTDQVTWALVAAKMRYVAFVLEFLEQASYGDARGTKLRLVLRRTVNRLLGNKLLSNGIERGLSDHVVNYIYDNIVTKL